MSEFLVVIDNDSSEKRIKKTELATLKELVFPDNVPNQRVETVLNDDVQFFVFNPRGATIDDESACFGHLSETTGWSQPGYSRPDGSYSIVRNDHRYTEALTDSVGSRTIWYLFTDEFAIISSRQRPIVYLKESFIPNENAATWMLCSGHLGPWNSWDAEVSMVLPDSRLRIDRDRWEIEVDQAVPEFSTETTNKTQLLDDIERTLDSAFSGFEVDPDSDILTLSGGHDSRAIAHHVAKETSPRSLTWGHPDALTDPMSDATIAADLAEFHGMDHTYSELNLDHLIQSPGEVLDKFVVASEGRIDHLAGYVDGLRIFEGLAERGFNRMIRGDHAYGMGSAPPITQFASDQHILWSLGMVLPEHLDESIPISDLQLPERCQRNPDESRSQWRDRLRQQVNLPIILGSLTSIKTPYLEVCNPLLTRSVVEQAREIPADYRAEKRLFKQYLRTLDTTVPIAESGALVSTETAIRADSVVDYLSQILRTTEIDTVQPGIVKYALDNITTATPEYRSGDDSDFRSLARDYLPRHIVDLIKRRIQYTQHIDPNQLAFRIYIIAHMESLLRNDAEERQEVNA